MITIRNLSKRPIVLNLAHALACSADTCTCDKMKIGVQDHNRVTGDRVVRAVNQRVPKSITLFPRGQKDIRTEPGEPGKDPVQKTVDLDVVTDLLPHVRRLPQVQKLLATREIEITDQPEATATAEPKPEAEAAPMQVAEPSPAKAPAAKATTKKEG